MEGGEEEEEATTVEMMCSPLVGSLLLVFDREGRNRPRMYEQRR